MSEHIIKAVDSLIYKHHTRKPQELIDLLNIQWTGHPLGRLKGYYTVINRERHIVTNIDLPEDELLMVLAHEIAHDRLHRHFALAYPMSDTTLFNYSNVLECQANLFAAELLIDDITVLNLINSDESDYFQMCNKLYVSPNFFAFKVLAMNKKGYQLNLPIDIKSNCLN